jgi:thioredoxin-like negative regulator of GroEL
MIREVTKSALDAILAAKLNVVLLFDAEWNRWDRERVLAALERIEQKYAGRIVTGSVDTDREREISTDARFVNVPALGFYRDGMWIETVVGAKQPVDELVHRHYSKTL